MHPDSVAGFRLVLAEARVTDSILLPVRPMERMVTPVQWMLRRVGADGIRLTQAGYLPPAVVVEASTQLDWGWPVTASRESHFRPLLELRAHVRTVGLLRVSRGMLLQTGRGRALAEAPRELWWHLARTVHQSRDPAEADALRLLLLLIARRGFDEGELFKQLLALSLEPVGWERPDGAPLSSDAAFDLVLPKWRLLRRLGVFDTSASSYTRWIITPGGAAFARAALQSEV